MEPMQSQIIFSNNVSRTVDEAVAAINADRCILITDTNVRPLIPDGLLQDAPRVVIPSGDINKNLETVGNVWKAMTEAGLSRRSAAVCIGGGMVTDLGGFAAATYKRGIACVNVPTTVLGAVDAAVGGKTGINFLGLKNQVGAFKSPRCVIIYPDFFATLPEAEILSGYGEILKHALLQGPDVLADSLSADPLRLGTERLGQITARSMEVKIEITARDPYETGLRKALNLGHTAGHAFEELALERNRPMPHGIAVAHGLVTALVLSRMHCGFPSDWLQRVAAFVRDYYPRPEFSCDDYPSLMQLMGADKKNDAGTDTLNFTLLEAPGLPQTDCIITRDDASIALDITRDLLGV